MFEGPAKMRMENHIILNFSYRIYIADSKLLVQSYFWYNYV